MKRQLFRTFSSLGEIVRQRRLPWFVERRMQLLENRTAYARNKFKGRKSGSATVVPPHPLIAFRCGFHGNTGGTVAIAATANLLATVNHVEFEASPISNFNRLLSGDVRTVSTCSVDADLYICDVSCDHDFMRQVKAQGKPLLVCCHGLRDALHGLCEERVVTSLALADQVQFVSIAQQHSFNLSPKEFTVIPNTTPPVRKRRITNNVGVVGNLDEPRKNAEATVRVGLASSADQVHLWGTNHDLWDDPRVLVHPFETNRETIYDSFDCLVFLSTLETFGMVVIEAMSAGIPCVLSPLPAFERFRDAPGVVFVDPEDTEAAVEAVNSLLSTRAELAEPLYLYYEKYFSDVAVVAAWRELVTNMTSVNQFPA